MNKIIPIKTENSFSFVLAIVFSLGIYKEYFSVADNFIEALKFFIPGVEIDYKNKQLIVDDITITEEI
jgi:hypothetical protein